MKAISDVLGIGLEPKDLGVLAVCLRAIIVFIVSLVMVRVAHKRFLSNMTAFDVILTFVLASALARAINGSAPFGATLVAGFVLVGLHRGMSALAFRWKWFGDLVKGHTSVLVQGPREHSPGLRPSGRCPGVVVAKLNAP